MYEVVGQEGDRDARIAHACLEYVQATPRTKDCHDLQTGNGGGDLKMGC